METFAGFQVHPAVPDAVGRIDQMGVTEARRFFKQRVIFGLSGDFVSQDLRECLYHLGEIVGGTIETDEVLGNIFRNFCIGK